VKTRRRAPRRSHSVHAATRRRPATTTLRGGDEQEHQQYTEVRRANHAVRARVAAPRPPARAEWSAPKTACRPARSRSVGGQISNTFESRGPSPAGKKRSATCFAREGRGASIAVGNFGAARGARRRRPRRHASGVVPRGSREWIMTACSSACPAGPGIKRVAAPPRRWETRGICRQYGDPRSIACSHLLSRSWSNTAGIGALPPSPRVPPGGELRRSRIRGVLQGARCRRHTRHRAIAGQHTRCATHASHRRRALHRAASRPARPPGSSCASARAADSERNRDEPRRDRERGHTAASTAQPLAAPDSRSNRRLTT